MSDATLRTLTLLSRLREAEARGARARLGQANELARRREEAEEQARKRHARIEDEADRYVADHIRDMAPTRDGASVYASLAYGAKQRRYDAASAELQHRRAMSRLSEAREDADTAAETFLVAEARKRVLAERQRNEGRTAARRIARREEDEAVETHAIAGGIHGLT